MKAVILCGGLGSRMGQLCEDIPKALVKIGEKSVIEHQLEALKKEGICDFVFVTGHLHEKIREYFSDGKSCGVNISYFVEDTPLGTAGALFKLGIEEDFLLCNGDLVFDFDLEKMYTFHKKNNALATLFTHPNTHPYDSTLISQDKDGRVLSFIAKGESHKNCRNLCNAGIHIISPELLKLYTVEGNVNLDRDILMPAVKTGRIFSFKSTEYVRDMGTPERLQEVRVDALAGAADKKRLDKPQRAVFLDRDGTVNVYKGFITNEDEIELIPGAAEAVKIFNKLGYLVIIVTNQSVIARGECTEDGLEKIHGRLESLLGENGAYIDDIIYCPHHPDSGFEGEVKSLKINCSCRKPSPGMLLKAKEKYNIDMKKSFMVGDSIKDAQAGKNAGCKPVLLAKNIESEFLSFGSLKEFSEYIKLHTEQEI